MSKSLKWTFLVHAVVAAVMGVVLLIKPGGFLQLLGWQPIDPLMSRAMGAALLAMAWTSLYGWRATERSKVEILVQMEAIFAVLACVGLGRHLFFGSWPWMPWADLAVFAFFAVAWLVALVKR